MGTSRHLHKGMEAGTPTALLARCSRLLSQLIRVHTSDGRLLVGRLVCLDAVGNTVLSDCEEAPRDPDTAAAETRVEAARRWIGLVNINPKHILRIECDARALLPSSPAS